MCSTAKLDPVAVILILLLVFIFRSLFSFIFLRFVRRLHMAVRVGFSRLFGGEPFFVLGEVHTAIIYPFVVRSTKCAQTEVL